MKKALLLFALLSTAQTSFATVEVKLRDGELIFSSDKGEKMNIEVAVVNNSEEAQQLRRRTNESMAELQSVLSKAYQLEASQQNSLDAKLIFFDEHPDFFKHMDNIDYLKRSQAQIIDKMNRLTGHDYTQAAKISIESKDNDYYRRKDGAVHFSMNEVYEDMLGLRSRNSDSFVYRFVIKKGIWPLQKITTFEVTEPDLEKGLFKFEIGKEARYAIDVPMCSKVFSK